MKRIFFPLGILSVFGFLAVSFFYRTREPDTLEATGNISHSPVPVNVTLVGYTNLPQALTIPAIIRAHQNGNLISELAGRVEQLIVTEGDQVRAGDTLLALDQALYRVELEKTRGDFFKALTEFISELQLTNEQNAKEWDTYLNQALQKPVLPPLPNFLSQSKLMSLVRYDLHNHYAAVKQAEQKLKQCVITAPFGGVVSDIQVFPGAGVSPGTVLLKLTDLSRMRVEIDVLETDLPYIHPGTPFQFVDSPADTFYVEAILPEIDPQTRCGKAIAVIPNENMRYKDGQKAIVKLVKRVYFNRLVVPRSAILTRNDRDLVFVVKSGIAKWQYVSTGVGNTDLIEILEGVSVGDTVVTGRHYSLAHDVPVDVIMETPKLSP